ncbi:hypothetical protein ACFXPJ_21460 [Streptomyces goshikiensis]
MLVDEVDCLDEKSQIEALDWSQHGPAGRYRAARVTTASAPAPGRRVQKGFWPRQTKK